MDLKKQRILVTGGGGFLGRAILEKLLKRGDQARSFSRGVYPELEAMGAEVIQGDICDKGTIRKACAGQDAVIHVAAKAGVWGSYEEFYQTNVIGTKNIIDGCLDCGLSRLIYTSSPSVTFDGTDVEGGDESLSYPKIFHSAYSETKALAEQAVLKATGEKLKSLILRPHLIWGPRDNNLVPRILKRAKSLAIVGNGKNRVDTVYIDNAAEAHILALDSLLKKPEISGKIYFISQGEPVNLWEMINKILDAGGKPPINKSIPHSVARKMGAVLEKSYKLFGLSGEPKMTRFVADELAASHWFDISAARRDLGYEAKISTEEGLKRLKKWLKENPI